MCLFQTGENSQLPHRRLNDPTQMSPLLRSLPAPQGRASSPPFLPHTRLFTAPPPMALPHCILFVFMSVFTTKPDHPWLILKPAWLSGGGCMLCSKTTGFKSWLEMRKHMTLNMWLNHFALQCSELKTGIKNTIPYSCCDDHQVNLQDVKFAKCLAHTGAWSMSKQETSSLFSPLPLEDCSMVGSIRTHSMFMESTFTKHITNLLTKCQISKGNLSQSFSIFNNEEHAKHQALT